VFYVKDARSVSLYPHNRSQIMQYVKSGLSINENREPWLSILNKLTLQKKLQNLVKMMCFWTKKVKI